jgi:hypothetical protein
MRQHDPIFVVGTQRSGTTLLCRMLSAHPNIFVKNEIVNPCAIFGPGATAAEVVRQISDSVRDSPAGRPLEEFLAVEGKTRWGLKDPGLTYCLPGVLECFPSAKMVVIIRDGRAVASSYLRTGWGVATNAYTAAIRWVNEVSLQIRFATSRPDACHLLRYEDLISRPEEHLQRTCAFLGEEFSPAMLRYHQAPAYIARNDLNDGTFEAIDPKLVDRWKNELTTGQVRVFEAVAGTKLSENGYQLTGPLTRVSPVSSLFYRAHQVILAPIYLRIWARPAGQHLTGSSTTVGPADTAAQPA